MSVRHPSEIRPWSGVLDATTAPKICDLLNQVLAFPCSVVTIVKHIDRVEVRPNERAEYANPEDLTLAVLHAEGSESWVSWSIAGHSWSIRPMDSPVRVTWYNNQLRFDLLAPAGHRLVWILAPAGDL